MSGSARCMAGPGWPACCQQHAAAMRAGAPPAGLPCLAALPPRLHRGPEQPAPARLQRAAVDHFFSFLQRTQRWPHPQGRQSRAQRSGGGRGALGRCECAAPPPPHQAPPGHRLQGEPGEQLSPSQHGLPARRRAGWCCRLCSPPGGSWLWAVGGDTGSASTPPRCSWRKLFCRAVPRRAGQPTRDRQADEGGRVGEVEAQRMPRQRGAGPH